MEAASRSESVEACVGRNLNGTFMIIRGAERRSGAGMVFLLDPGGHQVEIRGAQVSFTNWSGQGQALFHLSNHDRGDKCRRSSTKRGEGDRKSTRLNSSHGYISYAVFCLKKKILLPTPAARTNTHGSPPVHRCHHVPSVFACTSP